MIVSEWRVLWTTPNGAILGSEVFKSKEDAEKAWEHFQIEGWMKEIVQCEVRTK